MFKSTPILEVVEKQLLPWVMADDAPPLIVAHPRLKKMRMETDLPLIPKKIQGPRKTVRSFTFAGLSAQWPNDELLETHSPLLMFVLAGEADVHCGDYIVRVPKGRAILMPAGVPRRTGSESLIDLGDNPHRFSDHILFTERCGSLEAWCNNDRGNSHFGPPLNERHMISNPRLIDLLEEIQEEAKECRPFYENVNRRLLEVFLCLLRRDLQENKTVFPGRTPAQIAGEASNKSPIYQAQQYIRSHLSERLTQDIMARRVRLSRTQFIRRFREETGQTFNQFVTQCRLEQARVLLESTDFPLTFISHSMGYRSPVYFNTAFRKQLGMLPSEFRDSKKRPIVMVADQ